MMERPDWLKDAFVYNFEKIPMPFMKINIDQELFEKEFPECKITKVDITVGNETAIRNSDLIEHFTQS